VRLPACGVNPPTALLPEEPPGSPFTAGMNPVRSGVAVGSPDGIDAGASRCGGEDSKGPVPVIRQIHFSGCGWETSPSKTAAIGGFAEAPKPPKTQSWPLLVVPRISGQPVGAYELTVERREHVSGDAVAWSGVAPPTRAAIAVAIVASAYCMARFCAVDALTSTAGRPLGRGRSRRLPLPFSAPPKLPGD
jgi:hypothetical protein